MKKIKKWLIISIIGVGFSICALSMMLFFGMLFENHLPSRLLVLAFSVSGLLFLWWMVRIMMHILTQLEKSLEDIDRMNYTHLSGDEDQRASDSLYNIVQNIWQGTDEKYKSQIIHIQAEIQALQSQINPHFLNNTLDTIRSFAIIYKQKEIAEMTEALGNIFNYSISRSGKITTFSEELNNVVRYLLIQNYRFPGKITFIQKIDDDKDQIMLYRLPVLTIQPIVENAIFHGLESRLENGTITLRAYATQTQFVIQITDDGIGIPSAELAIIQEKLEHGEGLDFNPQMKESSRRHGVAIYNVNKRIQYFFGKEYGLHVMSTLQVGTTVEIILPRIIHDIERLIP